MNTATQLIRLPQIIAMTGMSKPTIYHWMRNGKFPKNIRLGERSVVWLLSDVEKWIESKINAQQLGGR